MKLKNVETERERNSERRFEEVLYRDYDVVDEVAMIVRGEKYLYFQI